MRALGLLFLFLFTSIPAQASLVSYPGGFTVVQENDYMNNSLLAHYSWDSQNALGLRSEYMRDEKIWVHSVQYNHLTRRWNDKDSQTNAYLMLGAGGAEVDDEGRAVYWVGYKIDYETRRLFLMYQNRFMSIESMKDIFHQQARIGFAPYEGGYNDLQTWLMLQLDHVRYHSDEGSNERFVVTPLVRLFKGPYLVEVGASPQEESVLLNWIVRF